MSVLGSNSVLGGFFAPPPPRPITPPGQAQAPAGVEIREFGDHKNTRKRVYDNVVSSLSKLEPLANQRYTLSLHDVNWVDPENYELRKQKEAEMTGKTLSRRVRGTWRLTDNTSGQVVDENTGTVAAVPYLTPRGTFIVNGTAYTMAHQQRLLPGVFTRRKENGELEAHVNILPGQGVSHRYFLDPETGVFKINIGQAKLPLLPVLRAMGTTDKELREHWGNDIYAANMQEKDSRVIDKLYARIVRGHRPGVDTTTKAQAVAETLNRMKLNPEVTKRTLGHPYETLSKEAVLNATRKLIRVGREEEDTDDRDHLAFQTFVGPEDVLAERFGKDKTILRQLLWKATNKGNLSVVQPGLLTRQLHAALLHTGLGQSAEEINPAELLDAAGRATRLGEGGIPSVEAVPDESRSVQPSHLGFIDPVRTPESFRTGVDTRMASAARKGSDGRIYAPFRDFRTGQLVYRAPQDLADVTIAFPGQDQTSPVVVAMQKGRMRFVPREQVDYEVPHFEPAFSPLGNMIPMKSAIKGQRMAMGSRYLAQALPLINREAPLVQSAMAGDKTKSYEDHFGSQMGAARAPKAGRVMKITPDQITLRLDDGTKETVDLYNNFPYARKTFIHNEPMVDVGQRVTPNQLLAKSNYTDDSGTTALGINPKVAFLPYKGHNYEDSIVISESMAKKLASEHMYRHELEWADNIKRGKANYASLFPGTFNRDTLNKLDEHGVIKPGMTVEYGDPLILAAQIREQTHSKIHRGRGPSYVDRTQIWEHHSPGVVTDVYHTPKGVTLAVKSLNTMQIGDKVSNRFGGKGVVSTIVPDDEMPHDEAGEKYEMLLSPLGMISRINPAQVIEMALAKIAKKTGKPYKIEDFSDIQDLAQFAADELKKHGMSATETVIDPTTGRRIPGVLSGHQFMMKLHHTSECFDAETDVLTARGWVPWPEAHIDDLFATIDNNKLIYEKPLDIVRLPFDGELYCFSGRYVDYAVTPNHRLYLKYYYDDKFKFVTADTAHGRRFAIPQFGFEPYVPICSSMFQLGEFLLDWNDYAELVGWWASEGYAKVTERRACVVIYQSNSANPEKFARIEALAKRLPFRWHYYRSKGQLLGIVISSRILAEHLRSFGTHSINKRLPRHLLSSPLEARLRLLYALMAGDGSITETPTGPNARYTTISKGLADDIQELCIGCGIGAVVRPVCARVGQQYAPAITTDGVKYKRPIKSLNPVWCVGIALARTNAMVDGDRHPEQFSIRDYSGTVYCATMRTGLLYVRRNGKPMLSGNSKGQGRAIGGYTSEEVPAKGGPEGSKRLALLETNALLSHGATEVLRDAHLVRGQKNDDYWSAFMSGFRPPEPQVPLVYRKFVDTLRGSGLNVVRNGGQTHIMALTPRDVNQLVGERELKNVDTVDWKEGLKPRKGGLFDPELTGGHGGNQWSYIKLHEPLPNPAFEEPIRRMLNLTEAKYLDVLAGKEQFDGKTGPGAIQQALSNINIDKALQQVRAEIAGGKKTARDTAVRKLQYLSSAQRLGIHPREWVLDKVPVLPPLFRPVSVMQGTGNELVADANYMYKELFDANQALADLSGKIGDVSEERATLYKAFKAVTGLGDPTHPKNQERRVKGLLQQVFGTSPKFGMVQRQLLGSTVDVVGRAVITPNADLDMDQVGIPETKAWEVYRPFAVRNLVRRGIPRLRALEMVEERHPMGREAILQEMDQRPVIISRAPVLHRFGIMAFRPQMVKGDVMQVSPLITKGFNADFDGDEQYATVYLVLTKASYEHILSSSSPETKLWWEVRKMPYGDCRLHFQKDHEMFCVRLEEFPHAAVIGEKENCTYYEVPAGIKVIAYDEQQAGPVLASVSGWSEHKSREIVLVNLRSGRQIITDDDPRAVYGFNVNTWTFERRRPAESIGMFVPRVTRISNKLGDEPLRLAIDSKNMRLFPHVRTGRKFGYMLGCLVGDGWVTTWHDKVQAVALACVNDGVKEAYLDSLNTIFNIEPAITTSHGMHSYGESRKLTVSSKDYGEFVKPFIGQGAQNKHLPPFYLSGGKEFALGLLEGLMDTDGSISISHGKEKPQLMCSISSTSLRLLQETQHLLRHLDVRSRITAAKTPAGNPAWILNISTVDFVKLPIQIYHGAKREALNAVKPSESAAAVAKTDVVPISTELAAVLMKYVDYRTEGSLYSVLSRAKDTHSISRLAARKVLCYADKCICPQLAQFKTFVADENTTWDCVDTYEETHQAVNGYDLTIPGYETFMSVDGVILSNTLNYHVPASDEAREEALEKLLPSRNLFAVSDFKAQHIPGMEFAGGLFAATAGKKEKKKPQVFATKRDAIMAYKRNELDVDDPVEIVQH